VLCLALAIWYECRECVEAERVQVAYTVVHRMKDPREFKRQTNVCSVVEAPKQFSFKRTRTPLIRYVTRPSTSTGVEGDAWDKALKMADDVLMGRKKPTFPKTLHFHTTKMKPPKWARKKSAKRMPNWLHTFYCSSRS